MNAFAKKLTVGAAVAALVLSMGTTGRAQGKDIVDTAVGAGQFKTLAAALGAAGLVDTLKGAGPFTVFAPTNAAFGKLPAGTVESLVKPENKATLTGILTYHVVPGRLTAANLMKAVKEGEGIAELKTVAGGDIWIKQAGPGKLSVTDAKGGTAMVTIADVLQSNGVIHVVDSVLLPG